MKFIKKICSIISSKNAMKLKFIPDSLYLQIKYYNQFERKIDFDNPTTFNEKIQWLKMYDRNPMYINLVDKFEAKKIIGEMIGEKYVIPTIGVWDSFDEIDFDKLPNQFVMKTTHDSGGVVLCRDKSKFDIESARNVINSSLKVNYFYSGREWPYKEISPRIIVEEYIDDNGKSPEDYKFLCFNGQPDNVMVCQDRDSGVTKYYFFDMEWKLMRCNGWGIKAPSDFFVGKPRNFEEMIEIAKKLSHGIPMVRVDLYNIKGKIYFGEMTFYPDSGFDNRLLPETDILFGNKLIISKKQNKESVNSKSEEK